MSSQVAVEDILLASGLGSLGKDPPADAVETAVRSLADSLNGSDPLRRAVARDGAIKLLKEAGVGGPARLLDAALSDSPANHEEAESPKLTLSDPEPWDDDVDGAELLSGLQTVLETYLALPDGASTALTLWTVHSHAHEASTVSPIMAITSPQQRCGKTTLPFLLGALTPRPLTASNITGPALFRAVECYRPTLLVDEADSFVRDQEGLRGILNSGHHRGGAYVVRTVGDDHEPKPFSTWAPKAIALIGKLPDTLADRGIEIAMRRRGNADRIERLRLDRLSELEPLRRRCWTWAQGNLERLRTADPDIPSGLHDRAADNWRPLLAISDRAGGAWPERARRAAVLLSGQTEDEEAATLLLGDLEKLFRERGDDQIRSSELVDALKKLEHRDWPEFRRGLPLTARGLARLLKPYGIGPRAMDWKGSHPKGTRGYRRSDFLDAWERYLPHQPPPPQVQPPQPVNNDGLFPDSDTCNRRPQVADTEYQKKAIGTGTVAEVAHGKGDPPEESPSAPVSGRRFTERTGDLFAEVGE
jgi:putative DNA primase/helicase